MLLPHHDQGPKFKGSYKVVGSEVVRVRVRVVVMVKFFFDQVSKSDYFLIFLPSRL